MRRPVLLILYAQVALILLLYYLNPFGLGSILDRGSRLSLQTDTVAAAEGIVKKISIKEYYVALTVDTGRENVLVRLSGLNTDDAASQIKAYDLVGRRVKVSGKLSLPQSRRNPGGFDYRLYLKGQGVYTIMEVSKYRISAHEINRPLSHFLALSKGKFYAALKPYMDDESFSVMAGLLFGDKSYMEEELYDEFRQTGIAHILAVSGLHVSLLYSAIEKIMKRKGPVTSVISIVVLYCYVSLSSFSVSVIRAAIMISLRILAFHLKRRYDMVCAAAVTAIGFLLVNPYQLFDSGFQLSFTAAYTMGVALPYINIKFLKFANRKRSELLYRFGKFFIPLAVIQIGMLPLTCFHFLQFSPVSLLINPIAIALAGIILPSGIVPYIISLLLPRLITVISAGPLITFLKALCISDKLAVNLGLSYDVPALPALYVVLYYMIFFWYFSETRALLNRKHKQKPLALIAAALIGFWIIIPKGYNMPDVCFADVGQGDCAIISVDGYHIMIDGGGSYYKNIGKDTIKPILLKNGITSIDLAIVSHSDRDHSKGLYELADCFPIKEIYDDNRENSNCTVCLAEINGCKYLFMGDADISRENAIISANPGISCDVIKLGHHGSATSTGENFLSLVNPELGIISCGLNNSYGHPADRVVELLQKSGIIYGRTDMEGAICVSSDGKDIKWHTAEDNQIRSIHLKQ